MDTEQQTNYISLLMAVITKDYETTCSILERDLDKGLEVEDMSTILHVAIKTGNYKMVKLLLAHGFGAEYEDINTNEYKEVGYGRFKILYGLKQAGYKNIESSMVITNSFHEEFVNAAAKGDLERVMELLLQRTVTIVDVFDEAPLRYAAQNNQVEVVKFLLQNGARMDKECLYTPFLFAARQGVYEVMKLYLEYNPSDELKNEGLILATKYGHINLVTLLVESGADIHVNSDAPLRIAIKNQDREDYKKMLLFFIEKGAETDIALSKEIMNKDKEGTYESITEMIKIIREEMMKLHM